MIGQALIEYMFTLPIFRWRVRSHWWPPGLTGQPASVRSPAPGAQRTTLPRHLRTDLSGAFAAVSPHEEGHGELSRSPPGGNRFVSKNVWHRSVFGVLRLRSRSCYEFFQDLVPGRCPFTFDEAIMKAYIIQYYNTIVTNVRSHSQRMVNGWANLFCAHSETLITTVVVPAG